MSRAKTGKAPTSPDGTSIVAEPPPLTRAQIRELDRRVRDLADRTRYLLVSVLTRKHALYYNVSEDTFGMDAPAHGTLFKRRAAAVAIQRLLRSEVSIIACRVSRPGRLIQNSVPRLQPNWRRKRRFGLPAKSRRA